MLNTTRKHRNTWTSQAWIPKVNKPFRWKIERKIPRESLFIFGCCCHDEMEGKKGPYGKKWFSLYECVLVKPSEFFRCWIFFSHSLSIASIPMHLFSVCYLHIFSHCLYEKLYSDINFRMPCMLLFWRSSHILCDNGRKRRKKYTKSEYESVRSV